MCVCVCDGVTKWFWAFVFVPFHRVFFLEGMCVCTVCLWRCHMAGKANVCLSSTSLHWSRHFDLVLYPCKVSLGVFCQTRKDWPQKLAWSLQLLVTSLVSSSSWRTFGDTIGPGPMPSSLPTSLMSAL